MILCEKRLWRLAEMQRVIGLHIVGVSAQLERILVLIKEWKKDEKFNEDQPLPRPSRRIIGKHFDNLLKAADAMSAPITTAFARAAVLKIRSREDVTFRDLNDTCRELSNVFQTELKDVELYCLSRGAGAFYGPKNPLFGEIVEQRMPLASDDIVEAGKCFAVGRYTASVFHLMRAIEAAVQALSNELQIPNVEREWGKLLSDIDDRIKLMPKGDNKDAWSGVRSNLYHVKQAWRNSTMHPKRTYTEEEAREVFDAMRPFMRELADLLPSDSAGA